MKADEFDSRLKELSAMVGNSQSTELFNQEYETLLNDIKILPDHYGMALRMRTLLMHQAAYLMNTWLRLNRIQGMI